jgi:hypothetical protein
MRKTTLTLILLLAINAIAKAQNPLDTIMPVRGFCIAAPLPKTVDACVSFIDKELTKKKVNTLILRVDYNYQYKSHPELRDSVALSLADVKKIVAVCKKNNINLIPQINLLGHQSWAENTLNLLRVYPEFDETPHVKMPEKYAWPNPDGLYCKSYCPMHPGVHKIVFALVDEIMDAFEAKDFHAGLDEVFYIGDDKCPRCAGRDKAELFAGEVNRIRNHLALKNRALWMWGDRLIDGALTGMGMWEASMNNTHRAIDLISKDVVICDWHYERPDKTAVIFAMKGLNVVTSPWFKQDLAIIQAQDMIRFRKESSATMKEKFRGMVITDWGSMESFLKRYYNLNNEDKNLKYPAKDTFVALEEAEKELQKALTKKTTK